MPEDFWGLRKLRADCIKRKDGFLTRPQAGV